MTDIRAGEQLLIKRVQFGDTDAFEELLAPYRRKLFLHIRSIVGNPVDADDAMQEASMRIFRGIKGFRGDAAFYTWAYRIAHNCGLTAHRRRHTIETREELNRDDEFEDHSERAGPDSIISCKQMAAVIENALESMNSEFQTAIVLHELEGLSYDEVAQAMVCPVGTVKSRISKAREEIALRLRRCGFTELRM
jgi:RNA polymerase sigma-70 factor, ECF subfamily